MNDLPDGVTTRALIAPLAEGWGFEVEAIEYAPVGFGSYHWVATDVVGTRVFVTVDDLDRKPWLGGTRESAFDGLTRAFRAAVALCDAGLNFVVAPILSRDRDPIRRLGDRHSLAVFPFVAGHAGRQFRYETAEERASVVGMLARLHRATSAVDSIAQTIDLELAGRDDLESGLRELDQPWTGGPFSEPARQAMASHAGEVADLLGVFDRLRREIASRRRRWVVTHGEPHPFNVMWTDAGPALIDWDAVAIAPPERDLWMLVSEDGDAAAAYLDATGHRLDPVAIDFFRLTWDLSDLAAYVEVLRAPHRDSEDIEKAFDGLLWSVAGRDRWAALLA